MMSKTFALRHSLRMTCLPCAAMCIIGNIFALWHPVRMTCLTCADPGRCKNDYQQDVCVAALAALPALHARALGQEPDRHPDRPGAVGDHREQQGCHRGCGPCKLQQAERSDIDASRTDLSRHQHCLWVAPAYHLNAHAQAACVSVKDSPSACTPSRSERHRCAIMAYCIWVSV